MSDGIFFLWKKKLIIVLGQNLPEITIMLQLFQHYSGITVNLILNFFFLWKRKILIVFFGVEFTGDYRDVAIISTLFRDRSQNSKNPNFSSFFLLLTVITK